MALEELERTVTRIAFWGCGTLAVLSAALGVYVLATGRVPERIAQTYRSSVHYAWHAIGLGGVFALLAAGAAHVERLLSLTVLAVALFAWLGYDLRSTRRPPR